MIYVMEEVKMIELIEPWYAIENDEKLILVNEYRSEVHENHILYNKNLNLIGRRQDRDDVLFSINGTNNLAIVHLTWSGKIESGSFPSTQILSIQDFMQEMKIENEMW